MNGRNSSQQLSTALFQITIDINNIESIYFLIHGHRKFRIFKNSNYLEVQYLIIIMAKTLFEFLRSNYDIEELLRTHLARRYKDINTREFSVAVKHFRRAYRLVCQETYRSPSLMTRVMFCPVNIYWGSIYSHTTAMQLIHHGLPRCYIIYYLNINNIQYKKSYNRKRLVRLLLRNNVANRVNRYSQHERVE